ncbi:hypothetical protein BU14_0109s0034 [Porphyra umbilicalis]|uniref:Uncharacterized protein n=1 Tax=Porphyra umbilicalis TaxID=2786 RepID=A0A1X6PC68_PORUM|nr:hypothetical protein BU14_0109s0034 [Porphyra umbilicalis]|eukprot:OSX78434.1 hypothetical protein BU14_0109s0034 [Porphyra umbilicalis]
MSPSVRALLVAVMALALVASVSAAPTSVSAKMSPVSRGSSSGTTSDKCFCAMWFNEGCTRIETFVCNSRDECKTACCEALDEDESATSADMHGIQC